MKKLLIMVITVSMLLAGCSTTKPVTNNEQNKYFPDGTFFTAELFVEFTEEFDDILVPEKGQAYIIDLRSEDEYNAGHFIGAVNEKEDIDVENELVPKLYDDYWIFIVGEDAAAERIAKELRENDRIAAYAIKGGYDALTQKKELEKYITTDKYELEVIKTEY